MRKKLLIMLLVLAALLGLTTIYATAASDNTVTLYVNTGLPSSAAPNFNTFDAAWSYANSNSITMGASVEIVLQSNATVRSGVGSVVSRNITITSSLPNYTLSMGDAGIFIVSSGYSLKLKNINIAGSSQSTAYVVSVTNGTLYMEAGATISGNITTAIYVNGANAKFNMNGGAITGNTGTSGGGVAVSKGTFTMEGGTISGNSSSADGGGVAVGVGGTFTMTGGTISNNTTGNSGGGVFVRGTFDMTNGIISGNTASSNGGGVFINSGTFTMENGTISNNTATNDGGGGVCVNTDATFTMKGGTIGGTTNDANTATHGGGVYLYGGTFNMENGTISSNTTVGNGGGVFVDSDGTFTMKGGSFTDNTATNGGGVHVDGGAFTMNDGTITDNTAANYGGGVYIDTGIFTMNGGEISNNTSADFGGGVYVRGTFTMNDGTISGNTAIYGGGVCISGGTFNMEGGTISGNTTISGDTATGGGSGVRVFGGTFTMNGGEISNNTSADFGGGVYVNSPGTFTMNDGTISGNTAIYGGGMYVYSGTFTMEGGTISGNTATDGGGGVRVFGGNFTMNGGEISNNTSPGYGGGVYVNGTGTFTMNDGTISGNTADSGGGVVLYSNRTFKLSGTPVVKDNKTTSGKLNNVFISSGTIQVTDSLTTGAEVWINNPTAEGGTFATATTADIATASAPYFRNDADSTIDATAQGVNLRWEEYVAQILDIDNPTTKYSSLNNAIAAYTNSSTQIIQLLKDITTASTVDKDIYLDLSGKNITGTLTVNNSCTLYGLDSATDNYGDGSYGKITGALTLTGTGNIAVQTTTTAEQTTKEKHYLKVEENGTEISFHRFNIQIGKYYFRLGIGDKDMGNATMQFYPVVQGNSHVAKALTALEASVTPEDSSTSINASEPVTTFTDLESTLAAGDPYYYMAELMKVQNGNFAAGSNPYRTKYAMSAILNFGSFKVTSVVRNYSLLDVVKIFYNDPTTTDELKADIDLFLSQNGLTLP